MRASHRRDPSGVLFIVLYGLFWGLVLVGVNLFAVVLTTADLWLRGGQGAFGEFVAEPTLPGWILVLTLGMQFTAMGGLVWGVDVLGRRVMTNLPPPAPWRARLAWRWPSARVWLPVTLIGLTAGWLPGWIADGLRRNLPLLDLGALESLQVAITEGPWLSRLGMWVGVVVLAPVFEEVLFRGWMWNVLARSLPTWGVWVATSLLFAVYHIDPIQGLALLFTAFALGWVRWQTGSLLPCVAIHGINNGLGVIAAHWGEQADVPLIFASAGAMVTVSMCGWLFFRAARDRASVGSV